MDWVNISIGLVGGFILSIIANLYTNNVRNWLAKRSLISKQKRISELEAELVRITEYNKQPNKFIFRLIRFGFYLIINTQLIILGTASLISQSSLQVFDNIVKKHFPFWLTFPEDQIYLFYWMMLIVMVIIFLRGVQRTLSILKDINALGDYEKFKADIGKRIKEIS